MLQVWKPVRPCRRKEEQGQALLLGCVQVPTMRVTEVPSGATPNRWELQVPRFEGVVLQTAPLRHACDSDAVLLSRTPLTAMIFHMEMDAEIAVGASAEIFHGIP